MVWCQLARKADEAMMDVLQRDDLSFPQSLPEYQRLFPDDTACAGEFAWRPKATAQGPSYTEKHTPTLCWTHLKLMTGNSLRLMF